MSSDLGAGTSVTGEAGRRLLAGLLLIASIAGCAGSSPPAAPDIFILLIDTLRTDRVGWYGDRRGVSPFLDELAARSSVFWRAYATSSWTNPSVASLFTSRFPALLGVSSSSSVLPESEATLAAALNGAGCATAGFSANPLIDR